LSAPVHLVPLAAEHHRIEGTVLRALEGVAGVPPEMTMRLETLRQRALLRHLLITAQLAHVGRVFDAAGLAWVAMKGPVVASQFYPDPGDRTYGDLDILVARPDYPSAVEALEELGFEHSIHNWALAEQMLAGQVTMQTESVNLDLHWHLHYSAADRSPFGFDPEEMIARRRAVVVSGVHVPTFDPVDTVLTLAFHAARSDGHRLVWLKDIERAIAVDRPDLDELERRCRAYRCGPPVGVMLRRAATLVEAEVPDNIVRMLTPRPLLVADRTISGLVSPIQFHDRPTLTRAFTRSVRSTSASSLAAGPGRAVRRLRRRLFPPEENETDDPVEKAAYLSAVVRSHG
jgi:hypothetical protein